MVSRKAFRLSHHAIADLEEIADYLGAQNPEAAVRVLETLHDAFLLLAENSELGMRRDDLHSGLRLFVPRPPADRYVILYYPDSAAIEISDIIHSARDWAAILTQRRR